MTSMTIGRLAREAGVGVETVRFYERRRLIEQPLRPDGGGFRSYPPHTLERLRFIRQAQGLGFSLAEIEDLLSLRADPSKDCGDVRRRAAAKLVEVERKIARLENVRAALQELIAACPARGALRTCSILGAIEGRLASGANGPESREGARA